MQRVIQSVIAFICAFPLLGHAALEGDYCHIPKLVQGEPTVLEVPSIDTHFCGVAIIDNKYVRLSEVMKAVTETTSCNSGMCARMEMYYEDEARRGVPYILIFQAPDAHHQS